MPSFSLCCSTRNTSSPPQQSAVNTPASVVLWKQVRLCYSSQTLRNFPISLRRKLMFFHLPAAHYPVWFLPLPFRLIFCSSPCKALCHRYTGVLVFWPIVQACSWLRPCHILFSLAGTSVPRHCHGKLFTFSRLYPYPDR